MNALVGLALTCGIIPGCYGGLMYLLLHDHVNKVGWSEYAERAAVLVAVPLFVSGLVKWWDVWIKPAPKLGASWQPISPSEYSMSVLRSHSIVAVTCIIAHFGIGQLNANRIPQTVPRETIEKMERLKADIAKAEIEWKAAVEAAGDSTDQPKVSRVVDTERGLRWKRDDLKKLEEEDATKEIDRKVANQTYENVPLTILILCAVSTSMLIPGKPRQHTGQAIGSD